MKRWALTIALAVATGGAVAGTLTCPLPAAAVQVAPCPSDDELRHTYTGYCSDNARLYGREAEICSRFENYRALKNTALWEAGDGAFQGYLSCELPRATIAALQPLRVAVGRQGSVTRVACSYAQGVTFTLRTKARCEVLGTGQCEGDPAACRVRCD